MHVSSALGGGYVCGFLYISKENENLELVGWWYYTLAALQSLALCIVICDHWSFRVAPKRLEAQAQKHEVTVANPSRQPTEKAIVWKDTLMVDYTHVLLLLLLRAGHGTGPVHEGGEY